jgi:hypothetical protein
MVDGISNRMAAEMPVPKYFPSFYLPFVASLFKDWVFPSLTPLTLSEFIDQLDKPEIRKQQFRDAIAPYEDLMLRDIPENKTQKSQMNPKRETYQKVTKPMRFVTDMNNILQVYGGCYIQPILHYCQECEFTVTYPIYVDGVIRYCHPIFKFIKGMDLINVPELLSKFFLELGGYPIYVCDFKTYEKHFDQIRLLAEHWFYKQFYGCEPNLDEWCRRVRLPKVLVKRGALAIKITDIRVSGSIDTALGNTISNVFLWCFMAFINNIDLAGGVVEGDDSAICVKHGTPTLEFFAECGISAKELSVFHSISKAGFCHLYWDKNFHLVRSPIELLLKIPISFSPLARVNGKFNESLLLAKCMSYSHLYQHCPIIAPFVNHLANLCGDVDPLYENDGYHKEYSGMLPSDVTFSTRLLVEKLFHILICDQYVIEEFLLTVQLHSSYFHPLLEKYFNQCSFSDDVIAFSAHYMN